MGKTLLLADDSVTIQKVVGISFASEDIAITTVDNGDDAIARAREMRPDVILADVVMPGKSGYEVCEAVKSDASLRHIPVLLLTGTFEAFDEERATRAGAAGQIAKPFEAHTLVERVKELLASTAGAAPAQAAPEAPVPSPAAQATPTPRPSVQATPPPAPKPAAPAPDKAFDFFDDPVVSEAPAASATPPPTAPQVQKPARPELEIEGPDEAFAFGEDDFGEAKSEATPRRVPPVAHTVAILPDDTPAEDEAQGLEPPAPPLETPPPVPAAPSAGPDPGLAESTLMEPGSQSAYDVSSSELGDLSVKEPEAPRSGPPSELFATPFPGAAAAPGAEPSPSDPDEDSGRDPLTELLSAKPVGTTAQRRPDFGDEPPKQAPEPEAAAKPMPAPEWLKADTEPEPVIQERMPEPEPTESLPEPEVTDPMDDSEPVILQPMTEQNSQPEIFEPAPQAKAPARSEPEAEAAPQADEALAQIAPALREQLHETLEKIAWEAFGRVTEKVVEESVERIEKIAWEIVPKLAETLISEEIRKLKGK